jgi:hypothetical protein
MLSEFGPLRTLRQRPWRLVRGAKESAWLNISGYESVRDAGGAQSLYEGALVIFTLKGVRPGCHLGCEVGGNSWQFLRLGAGFFHTACLLQSGNQLRGWRRKNASRKTGPMFRDGFDGIVERATSAIGLPQIIQHGQYGGCPEEPSRISAAVQIQDRLGQGRIG